MTSTPNTQTQAITGDLSGAYPDGLTLTNAVLTTALATGSEIKTGTTAADTILFRVYDVNGAAYQTFMTLTANNTPDVAIVTPTGGTLSIDAATGAEIKRACDVSVRVVALATSTSITEVLHEGKICSLTGTGSAYTQTLPAATGGGAKYTFVVGAVNTSNHILLCAGSDTFYGQVFTNTTTETPDVCLPYPSAGTNTKITLNGTTSGGAGIGDIIHLTDAVSGKWCVTGFTKSSGTVVTPFGT